ncbi:MAG: DNA repair protein RecO [Parachlamydiales bacterium]|nr:DNA repair protein RecO [Parachlamydiales bacterium]
MSEEANTEALILGVMPFKEYDRIVTIFTPYLGLVKFYFKGRQLNQRQMPLTPLTRLDLLYKQGQSDLLQCKDIKILDSYQALREDYTFLKVGCDMANAMIISQYPHKPAPHLYALLLFYLQRIPFCPQTILSSFYLKTLIHEGLLSSLDKCAACQDDLQEAHLASGEAYCNKHAQPYSFSFNAEEWIQFCLLAKSRSFSELQQSVVSLELSQKIEQFFKVALEVKEYN